MALNGYKLLANVPFALKVILVSVSFTLPLALPEEPFDKFGKQFAKQGTFGDADADEDGEAFPKGLFDSFHRVKDLSQVRRVKYCLTNFKFNSGRFVCVSKPICESNGIKFKSLSHSHLLAWNVCPNFATQGTQ